MNPNALTVHEVAEQLNISTKTVYKMAKAGELDSYRVGRKLFFTQGGVDALVLGSGGASKTNAPRPVTSTGGEVGDLLTTLAVDESDFLIGGSDVCTSVIAGKLRERGIKAGVKEMSSYSALVHLYLGDIDACVVHIFDQKTKTYNTPYVRRLVPGIPVKVVHLCTRMIGLCVRKNSPSAIKSLAGAVRHGATFANQKPPADARIFLDECLCAIEAVPGKVSGYKTAYESDFAAINAVAEGKADVCIANVDAASGVEGVLFVALGYEQVDLVVRKDKGAERLQKAVWALLADKNLPAGLEAISKCNTAKLGQVVYEI